MRQMGAAIRQMLETAAAKRWDVDAADVRTRNHQVVHAPSGRALGFGDLALAARDLPVPRAEDVKLKRPRSSAISARAAHPRSRGDDERPRRLRHRRPGPGMKYAVIARPPVYGGRVASYDGAAALAVPGVEGVVKLDGTPPPSGFQPLGGVAVIARIRGRRSRAARS